LAPCRSLADPYSRMLYIDCGHTAAGMHYTGIQRYVRHTLRHAQTLLGPAQVGAIGAGPGGWSMLPELAAHPLEGLPAIRLPGGKPCFNRHSHVLLADRFWHTGAWDALDLLVAGPARITVVVYDLLSLQQPEWFPAGLGKRFERYLRIVLPRADHIICLSATVQAELRMWMLEHGMAPAPVTVVQPGHQVWSGEPQMPPMLPLAWTEEKIPFVLQVGTLEPRKNHALTLSVMQGLWARGAQLGCLFIGQRGWLVDSFAQSLEKLPQWQSKLMWLVQCTDAQLDWCYRHAAAVIYPSIDEGYGLPLAEAAACGAPVIASKAPAHLEVAGVLSADSWIRLCELNAADLTTALEASMGGRSRPRLPSRSWSMATRDLLLNTLGPATPVLRSVQRVREDAVTG